MKVLRVTGSPVYAAVTALAAAHDDPELLVAIDLTALEGAEGELMGLGMRPLDAPAWFTALGSAIWPGFQTRDRHGLQEYAGAVALVDPVQCLTSLEEAGAVDMDSADFPEFADREVLALDRSVRPARMVQIDGADAVTLPIVYDAGVDSSTYSQLLPCGSGLLMSRERSGFRDAAEIVQSLRRPGWKVTV